MAQFNLTWDVTSITDNPNVTGQKAETKPKTSSTWVDNVFTPAYPWANTRNTASTIAMADNVIHQFRIVSVCTLGGPIYNIGGVYEAIGFACIVPVITNTGVTATATVSLVGTDITKVRFSVREMVGSVPDPATDPVKLVPTVVVRSVTNLATMIVSGLDYDTDYYWETELYATLRNGGVDTEIISSNASYMDDKCRALFTTGPAPVCAAVTGLTVTSVG